MLSVYELIINLLLTI